MKIGIFTGGTSVRSKNIFTAISRYPIRKHEINISLYFRLKEENRRMLQEKAENEQVIKLLETQKEVLSKSVRDSKVYLEVLASLGHNHHI